VYRGDREGKSRRREHRGQDKALGLRAFIRSKEARFAWWDEILLPVVAVDVFSAVFEKAMLGLGLSSAAGDWLCHGSSVTRAEVFGSDLKQRGQEDAGTVQGLESISLFWRGRKTRSRAQGSVSALSSCPRLPSIPSFPSANSLSILGKWRYIRQKTISFIDIKLDNQ
jgi:hypothetical protein